MGVATSRCTVDNEYDTYVDYLINPKSDFDHRFLRCELEPRIQQSNLKKRCMYVLKNINSYFLGGNLTKSINYAYEYVMENFGEEIKQQWDGNINSLCAGIYYFLARRHGFTIKKSSLAKVLGIKISQFDAVFRILQEIQIFKGIVIDTRKREDSDDLIESIPVSGIMQKIKKPPKESEKISTLKKISCFPFFPFPFSLLFYDFVKKLKLENTINIFPTQSYWYRGDLCPKPENRNLIGIIILNLHNLLKLGGKQFNLISIKTTNQKNLGECDFKYLTLVMI